MSAFWESSEGCGTSVAAFDCIPGKELKRIRYFAGEYDATGTWVEADPREEIVSGVAMPAKNFGSKEDLRSLEGDGRRKRDWIKIYSPPGTWQVMDEDKGIRADKLCYQDTIYEIRKVNDYTTGVLDHDEAYAIECDVSDES